MHTAIIKMLLKTNTIYFKGVTMHPILVIKLAILILIPVAVIAMGVVLLINQ